jgi:hypothetical protein
MIAIVKFSQKEMKSKIELSSSVFHIKLFSQILTKLFSMKASEFHDLNKEILAYMRSCRINLYTQQSTWHTVGAQIFVE